jgi:hypothetical protein
MEIAEHPATDCTVTITSIGPDGTSRTEITTPGGAVLRLDLQHGDRGRAETSRGVPH